MSLALRALEEVLSLSLRKLVEVLSLVLIDWWVLEALVVVCSMAAEAWR